MNSGYGKLCLLLVCGMLIISVACQKKKEGAIEGVVNPAASAGRVTVLRDGATVSASDIDRQSGKFRIALAAGTYDVTVSSPAAPYPVTYTGITIEPGRTTTLPLTELTVPTGAGVLTGTISPSGPGTVVTLIADEKERASINTSAEGTYEFKALPAGDYTLRVASPGYADDSLTIHLGEDQKATQNIRLVYVSPIGGIDWKQGAIHATGRGVMPPTSPNRTIAHEMARRAALAEAQRNLLEIIGRIMVDPSHDLKSIPGGSASSTRIQGFIQGYKIVGERDVDNGVEVELELPLTGPNGLTRFLPQ